MIAVDSITEQELDKRFDALPSKLKEALTSERNLSVVDQVCENNKIGEEEKVTMIHQLVGLSILGIVHTYDLGSEINEALSLNNPKFSNAIAEELTAKVFSPIKTELENNYHPITAASVEEKKSPAKTPTAPAATSRAVSGGPIPQNVVPNPSPAITKPSILSDVGWSKTSVTGPGISLHAVPGTMSVPKPPAAPTAPAAPKEPAPVILHEDTTFKAVDKNAGFTLSKPGAGAEVHMNQTSSVPTPPRPAVLEFGGAKPPTPKPTAAAPSLSSAVHYTELKLSLSAIPAADTGPRTLSQVSPPAPRPPVPPQDAVPAPPRPAQSLQSPQTPQPAQPQKPPQNNKPIVKDFL